MDLYPFCEDTFMWPSVNGNVLTNRIDIRSEKTHEVTRCKQALNVLYFCAFILGESFKSLGFQFRMGSTTIGRIVEETCKALHHTMKKNYLKVCNHLQKSIFITESLT